MIFGINRYSIKSSQMPLLIPVLLSVSIIPTGSVFATGFVDGIKVKPYHLQTGETVHSVAHQYNLTVEELKTLNQKRNFARAFEQLSVGDQIDVPMFCATKSGHFS